MSWPPVVSGYIGSKLCSMIGPSSSPTPIFMTVTPVIRSPASSAATTGAAPRYFGRSEKWQLTQPKRGRSRSGFFSIWPNATTTTTSGFHARILSIGSGSFTRSGLMISLSPFSAAYFARAHGDMTLPRPVGRSGCVTTPTISNSLSRRSAWRHSADAGEEPMKTIRIVAGYYIISRLCSVAYVAMSMRRRLTSQLRILANSTARRRRPCDLC